MVQLLFESNMFLLLFLFFLKLPSTNSDNTAKMCNVNTFLLKKINIFGFILLKSKFTFMLKS